MLLLVSIGSAQAQLAGLPTPFVTGGAELWTGVQATPHAWSSYTGLNWAPLGKLADDGLRLRFAGGYGEYRYAGPTRDGRPLPIHGKAAFADVLVGYQLALGALTLKAYAGATFEGHLLEPSDPANSVSGSATGAKGALEGWLELGPTHWAQLDLAYGDAHAVYSGRLRLGWRLTPALSIGVEGGGYGNAASDNARAGAFVRYEWLSGELSASGGLSGDMAQPRNPYGSVVYLTRF